MTTDVDIVTEAELFENEQRATKLLSKVPTLLDGIELVLGRSVDTPEISGDETLKDLFDPRLTGADRLAMLRLKKETESIQNKSTTS